MLQACLHVALSGESPPYPAMIVLSSFVDCKLSFTSMKEQGNIQPNRVTMGVISCAEFGPRLVLQERIVTTT